MTKPFGVWRTAPLTSTSNIIKLMSRISAAVIRYDIRKLEQKLEVEQHAFVANALRTKIANKKVVLAATERLELKDLAKTLTYKADIYYATGRIYSADAKWTVTKDGKLMHGDKEIRPELLRDGHGRTIISDSDY